MTFKSKNKDPYNVWRLKNLNGLLEAGVPKRIAKDNRQFWFLVQEGEELGYDGWNPGLINDEQASSLLELLAELIDNEIGWELVGRLKRKLGRDHPYA